MDFYHPQTREKLGPLSPEDILNIYGPYCSCKKNSAKKRVSEATKNLDPEMAFATYGNCPLNAIGAIIFRQAASLLLPEPNMS